MGIIICGRKLHEAVSYTWQAHKLGTTVHFKPMKLISIILKHDHLLVIFLFFTVSTPVWVPSTILLCSVSLSMQFPYAVFVSSYAAPNELQHFNCYSMVMLTKLHIDCNQCGCTIYVKGMHSGIDTHKEKSWACLPEVKATPVLSAACKAIVDGRDEAVFCEGI